MANERFRNALGLKAQKIPPVWMMRQAGRYHKHYQALRAKYGFAELCKLPDIAAEVAAGPIEDFDFDVSILFSDLLFPLEGLGMGLEYTDSGPRLGFQLSLETLSKLRTPEEALRDLAFQGEAVRKTRARLPSEKSLIGFVGGPWTLFVYAVEGGHAGNLIKSKTAEPLYREFCERMVPLLRENIRLQLDAGCEVVMIFDTAAGELAPEPYRRWVEPELQTLFNAFPGRIGYYSKGTQPAHFANGFLAQPVLAGAGFDHRWDLPSTLRERARAGAGFTQGNFDQAMLFLEPDAFARELDLYLESFARLSVDDRRGWVCGLGHGVLPKTPEENVRRFVTRVREFFG